MLPDPAASAAGRLPSSGAGLSTGLGAGDRETPPESAGEALARSLPGEIAAAAERLAPHLAETPFEFAPGLSALRTGARTADGAAGDGAVGDGAVGDGAVGPAGVEVLWKLECFQVTGSFKVRGALNKLLRLQESEGAGVLRNEGVVTASSGNHARAVAWALSRLGGRGLVFLPETVADSKRRALEEQYREVVELRLVGEDAIEAERAARAEAERSGRRFVSPYNDPDIVAGQGTVGREMDRSRAGEPLDAVLVPVGGGGLAAGIAAWLRRARPDLRLVGCQPLASAVLAASVRAGRILESGREAPFEPTLADGVAGGVEEDSITLDLCSRLLDDWILVSEAEIAAAMRRVFRERFAVVEGSAALPVAALPHLALPEGRRTVGLVLSGAGITREGLRLLLEA